MSLHICGRKGERSAVPCVVCEVVEDAQERAFDKGWCGAVSHGLVCDRESGHAGAHRGYRVEQDVPVFWSRT
jgi:hypothetical protein